MNPRSRIAWALLAPTLLSMLLVAGWPLGRSIWFSLTQTSIDDLSATRFVGLGNYVGAYGLFFNPNQPDGFWASDWGLSIVNTFQFATVSVGLETLAGLGVAMLLNQQFRGRALVRVLVLVPWAIPTIVSARIWGWMLNDQYGIINRQLVDWGLIAHKIAWTADPAWALWTVVAVDVWKTTPFMALLILAALQTLPRECYEAARVDGVHPLRVFLKVTLPLIRHPLMVAVVFRLLDALRIFDLIFVLTANSSSTISMSGFVRREMVDYGHVGVGSAASTSLMLMVLLAALLLLRATRVRLAEASA
jgi:trehalose/maltose transport system permease protein